MISKLQSWFFLRLVFSTANWKGCLFSPRWKSSARLRILVEFRMLTSARSIGCFSVSLCLYFYKLPSVVTPYAFSSPTHLPNSHIYTYLLFYGNFLTYFWLWTFSLTICCSPGRIFPAINSQMLYPRKDLDSQDGQPLVYQQFPYWLLIRIPGTLVN